MDSSILSKYQAISLARNFSDQKIQELRNSLSNDSENENEDENEQQCSVV